MIYTPLKSSFQALACISVKFRRPYKLETTLDLGVLVLVARCEASLEKAWTASLPQAPYDSTTRGMHVHPSSEHIASLAKCFLSSVATAADPAVRSTSERRDGFSGDVTERSKVAGLPQSQFELRCQQDACAGSHIQVTASFCLGTDAGMMARLEHYIPELIVPGYSITTSLTCQGMVS